MRSDLVGALGSVRASLFLGGATAALLVLASFFVPNPRSREALPFNESIRVFFDPVSLDHAWFYALLVVVAAYGVNAVFGTWVHAARRLAAGGPDRRFVGIVLMHVGFILGLCGHLVAGFGTAVEEQAVIGPTPSTVAGHVVRLVELHDVRHPDGSLRTLRGVVELDGELHTLGFNDPIFLDGLRRWILVTGAKDGLGVVVRRNEGLPWIAAASVVFVAGLTLFAWAARGRTAT